MSNFKIRASSRVDEDRISEFIAEHWGADIVVVHDTIYKPSALPGFIAFCENDENEWLGLITYHIEGDQREIPIVSPRVPPACGFHRAAL